MDTDESQELGAIYTPAIVNSLSAISLSEESPHETRCKNLVKGVGNLLKKDVPDLFERLTITNAASTSGNEGLVQQEVLVRANNWGNDERCWAEMLPDVLAKIFSHLSLKERICTIPCVCRYWQCVSQDAACWQDIDLSEWSPFREPKEVDRMLLLLVNRSQGSLRRVCVPDLQSDSMLRLIASSASQLQVLEIADSFVSEECLCELAPKFSALTFLDISGRFPSKTLIDSFGNHCPSITQLNINMRFHMDEAKSCDVAALAIAQYMPQLQHLEMACCSLSNVGLKAVLSSCKNLKHLDIRGCFYVDMEDPFVMEAKKTIKVFLEPVLGDDMIHFTDEDDDIDSDQFFEDAEYYDDMMPDDVSIDDIDYYGSDMMEDMPFYLDQTEYYAHFDGGRSL